jgi:hypothetical protein
MRFTGSVETGRVAAALILPAEAVFPTSDGPVAYRDARVGFERVALRLGVRTAKSVEVIDGLAEGDRVSTRDLSAAGGEG